jgi:hypothetical protein
VGVSGHLEAPQLCQGRQSNVSVLPKQAKPMKVNTKRAMEETSYCMGDKKSMDKQEYS